MAPTLCTSGLAIQKAGKNVHADIIAGTYDVGEIIEQVEAQVSLFSRYDWVANFGTVEANFKPVLEEVTSDMAAIYLIEYDMSGYTSRIEAEDMITVLRDSSIRILSLLKDQKGVTYGK